VRSPSALNDTALLNGSVVKSDDVSDRLLIALSTVASTIRDETLPSSQANLDDRAVHEDILNKDQNPQYYLPPEHHGATEHNQNSATHLLDLWVGGGF